MPQFDRQNRQCIARGGNNLNAKQRCLGAAVRGHLVDRNTEEDRWCYAPCCTPPLTAKSTPFHHTLV
eukprot:364051-Chlamydomonas_euryale.AAC.16